MAGVGRPSEYNYELCKEICEEVANGENIIATLKGNDDVLLQAGNKTGNALMQQLAYVGFQNTRKKALAGDYSADPDQDYASSFFLPFTRGRADETTNVDPSGMTTPVDGYEGNTDFGQLATMYGPTYLFEGEDPEDVPEECNCKDGQVAKVVGDRSRVGARYCKYIWNCR